MAQEPNAVESRLWEDPFEAFETASNGMDTIDPLSDWPTNIENAIGEDVNGHTNFDTPVAILGVMMPGGSYAEDKEVRLRIRYAVELALLTKDMNPFDSAHIFTNAVRLDHFATSPTSRMSRYAYEWFEAQRPAKHLQACVLWMNEQDFADKPVLKLASLLGPIHSLTHSGGLVNFFLIGPRSSDTLRGMVNTGETGDPPPQGLYAEINSNAVSILSPEATAIYQNFDEPTGTRFQDQIQSAFGAKTKFFHNWIASDLTNARLIAREIKNRMFWFSESSNNVVVLISEQDSLYGRSLADEWTHAIWPSLGISSNQVWQFSYLRGLDGSKPPIHAQQQTPISSDSPEAFVQNVVERQQEEGQSADGDAQLDYVIRLTQFLKQRDDDLKWTKHGRIVAFGLTGSDAYDKLILLEELRRKFPEAIFFTSDIDASYLTAKQLKFTIGLLVSSGCSIVPTIFKNNQQLNPEQFPPFRDDYQTAVFLATEHIIDSETRNDPSTLDAPKHYSAGGLYIIGRHRPIRITDRIKEPLNMPWKMVPREGALWVGLAVSLLLILYFAACASGGIRLWQPDSKTPKEFRSEKQQAMDLLFLAQVCVVLASIALLTWLFFWGVLSISSRPDEEPLFFSEGTTIWPSECIRFLVVVLTLLFLFVAYWRRQRHRKRLWEDYFSEGERDSWKTFYEECSGSQGEPASLFWEWRPPIKENDRSAEKHACVDALGLFCCYLRIAKFPRRACRIILCMGLYLVIMGSLFYYLNDVPLSLMIRGQWSHIFDFGILILAISCNLFVLFYVLDSTLLTKRLLDYLGRHPTYWPKRPVEKGAREFGLDPKDLDSWLDVDFAAVQTNEIGPLMFGPIILQLLMLLSRIPYFDNWTWPVSLIVIFALNFLAAAVAWWIIRHAAENVRKDALQRIAAAVVTARSSDNEFVQIPEVADPWTAQKLKIEKYLENLKALRDKIEKERRGAFALWFQDPTYLAVFVPSGVSGVVSLISAIWLK
ncbi:MAG TPA: hypothetical protein VMF08_18565 [Candidatus Sulfotelmatobacter sp.]|nr:hypothetical protein [Candidatus Sulfotelmatobacter sp.]